MLDLCTSLALIPYLLAAAYALKLGLIGESYDVRRARQRRKETIVAGIATAYTLFLFDAAGLKFLLLSTVHPRPGHAALRQGPQRARTPDLQRHRDRRSASLIVGRRASSAPSVCGPAASPSETTSAGTTRQERQPMTESVSSTYGVHSEVGRLRKVLVCAPGLAHRRLTPSNNDELLFDDVMWVENAQRDHADFVNKLHPARRRGRRAARPARARRWRSPGRATGCWTARSSPTRSGSAWSTRTRALPGVAGAARSSPST